jgi:hypothetical protein
MPLQRLDHVQLAMPLTEDWSVAEYQRVLVQHPFGNRIELMAPVAR